MYDDIDALDALNRLASTSATASAGNQQLLNAVRQVQKNNEPVDRLAEQVFADLRLNPYLGQFRSGAEALGLLHPYDKSTRVQFQGGPFDKHECFLRPDELAATLSLVRVKHDGEKSELHRSHYRISAIVDRQTPNERLVAHHVADDLERELMCVKEGM